MKKKQLAALAAVGALASTMALPGCDDNDDGGPGIPVPIGPTAAPTTAATGSPTLAPTSPGTQSFTAPVSFPNGQSGTLSLRVSGTTAAGSLVVRAPGATAARVRPSQVNFVLVAGTYSLAGTFTPPRGFRVTGAFPAPAGPFTITGTIPTSAQAGAYALTAAGQTVNGVIPIAGANPTPTMSPTSPPGGGIGGSTSLAFAPGSGYNGLSSGFTNTTVENSNLRLTAGTGVFSANVASALANNGSRRLTFSGIRPGGAIATGTTLPAVSFPTAAAPSIQIVYTEGRLTAGTSFFIGAWASTGGTVRFVSVSPTSLTMQLQNVAFSPYSFGNRAGAGTFTLNGTVTINNFSTAQP